MHYYLKSFDTIRFYAPWYFFGIFFHFSIFWIQILNLTGLAGGYRNRTRPVTPVTAVTDWLTMLEKNLAPSGGQGGACSGRPS
jgi:hypothetical protein